MCLIIYIDIDYYMFNLTVKLFIYFVMYYDII